MIEKWPENSDEGSLGDGRPASATERPGSVEELRDVVKRRTAEGFAIYPQGGRASLDYGGIPKRPGVAVSTLGLNRVIDYPHADMTVTVEAGITMAELAELLGEKGQRLAIDVPEASRATLGGVYATNTWGPRRFGAGRPRDCVIGASFVSAAGDVVKGGGRVVKNVAGYDLPKLLTGSMGTLGILTCLTLKVRPKPETSAILWATFPSARDVEEALTGLNVSASRPSAVELLNRSAGERVAGTLGLPVNEWNLAVGLEDNTPSIAWQMVRLKEELSSANLETPSSDVTERLWSALTEFPARPLGDVGFEAGVLPSDVVGFANEIDPAVWAIQAHAGNGTIRGRLIASADRTSISAEVARLRAWAEKKQGSLILSKCPTAWKESLDVWGTPRPEWDWCRKVKTALDPGYVLNPGRFVGGI